MLMPYSHLSPGSKDERRAEGRQLSGGPRGQSRCLHVAARVRVPDVVAEPGRVGQQVAQRDRPLRRTQLGRAGGVEALQHLGRAQARVDVRHGLLDLELALLDELHRRHGGDRLGHRGDAEDGVERHRRALVERAQAEGPFVEHALVGRGHGHHARHFLGVDGLPQDAVDLRLGAPLGGRPASTGGPDRCGSRDGCGSLQYVATAMRCRCHALSLLGQAGRVTS